MSASTARPTLATVLDYFSQGIRGVLEAEGMPHAMVVIDPAAGQVGLRVPVDGSGLDLDTPAYRNLEGSQIIDSGIAWQQLMVMAGDDIEESYAFVCAVVDRVQLGGVPLAEALAGTVGAFQELLAVRRGLTTERQIGLMGELLALIGVVKALNPKDGLASWRGADLEEHDFGLPSADLEVKSTASERRVHWISSVTQLVSTGERPLYLLSVQFTRAGVDQGLSLPALVEAAQSSVGAHAGALDAKLISAGFRATDADLYTVRWTLRTPPVFLLVDDHFPVISPARLEAVVPGAAQIVDVRYRINVDAISPSPDLFAIPPADDWKDLQ